MSSQSASEGEKKETNRVPWIICCQIHTNTSPSPVLLEESRILSSCLSSSLPSFLVMLCWLRICSYTFKFCSLLYFGHQHLNILRFHLLREILSLFHVSTSVPTHSLPNLVLIIDFKIFPSHQLEPKEARGNHIPHMKLM